MKITLIKITEQLRALSIDRVDKRLFWVQFGPQGESAIASCDYNGNALHTMNLPLQWVFSKNTICYSSFNFVNKENVDQSVDVNDQISQSKATHYVFFLSGLIQLEYLFFWSTYTTPILSLGL